MVTREQLVSIEVEQLADMLLKLYASNKDIQKQMDLLLAGLLEGEIELIAVIKKELSSLKRSTAYIDYYESEVMAKRLDELRISIVVDLQKKSPEQSMELIIKLLDLSNHVLNRSDDSNGVIQSVFIQTCDDLGKIAQNVSRPVEEFVDIVFEQFINNDYTLYDGIIESFKDILKEKGLRLLQERFESCNNENVFYAARRGLMNIADCFNDVDAYVRASSFKEVLSTYDFIKISQRLVLHNRAQEALNYIEKAMQGLDSSHVWYNDAIAIKIDALEGNGDRLSAQNERIAWFNKELNGKIYDQILQHMPSELHVDFINSAIKQAFSFSSVTVSIDFLMHIKNMQELSNFIYMRFDDINGNNYYNLRSAADLLKDNYPLAATLLYRKMIQPVLEKASSKYYIYAAKDLMTCALLNLKIIDWQSYDNHEKYFEDIVEKHKRKPRFWETYKSAAQKQASKEIK